MRFSETKNEGLARQYEVTIPASDIEAKVDAQLAQVAGQIRMPGFRPGKVPKNLVRKMHGQALQREALQTAVQESVQKVIADNALRPAMQPSVDLADVEDGKDISFKMDLEVLPTFDVPEIEGVKLEKLVVEPSDEDMDEALQRLGAQQKSFEAAPKAYKAKTGDVVVMDYAGKVGGESFEGGTGENMQIELGSGRLIPGFEDQLVGAKANDQKTVKVTFPDDYNVAYLKGKEAEFEVTVNEVRTAKEAKLDDEMAKNLGLEGLDQLKGIMKDQLSAEMNQLTRTHMKRKLLDKLAASYDFAVPPSMVEAEFNQIWHQLEHEASHAEDQEAARKELEGDKDEYRRIAERRVRLGLLLSEIGQKNNVQVSQQEMNRLVAQEAQKYPGQQEQVLRYFRENAMAAAQLRAPLFEDKVVDLLLDKAEIAERKVTKEELQQAIEDEDETPTDAKAAEPKAKKAPAKKKAAKADQPAEANAADESAEKPQKKAPAKKSSAKSSETAEAPAEKKAPAKKAPARKTAAKSEDDAPAAKKTAAKKAPAKKAAAKKED